MSVATQQRPGCAAVHLRHIRKTGGGSVRHVLFKLGYRRARIFGSNDEKTAYKRELDLLSTSRHFFDEHQAGKRVFYEYHSPWDIHGPWFLQQLRPRLPALRRAFEARNCTLLVVLLLREPVSHLLSDYFYFENEKARRFRAELVAAQQQRARSTGLPGRRAGGLHPASASLFLRLQFHPHLLRRRPERCRAAAAAAAAVAARGSRSTAALSSTPGCTERRNWCISPDLA